MPVQTAIQVRRGTASSWTSTNPTLAAGEIGFETDTSKFKIGTGSTAWNSLNYFVQDPVTTKGDLYTFSTTDTRLAVGNNGETLVADSSATTGLRWQGSAIAKNAIYNSAFDVWQRGTSFAIASSAVTYTADRWFGYRAATGSTISRQTGTNANAYEIRVQRDSGNTSTSVIYLGQPFEIADAIQYQGKTVVVSFWARAGANYSATSNQLSVVLNTGTGTTERNPFSATYTGSATPISTNVTLTTSWQRFSASATLGSTVTQFTPYFQFTPVGTAGAADYFEISNVQLELGSVATPYSKMTNTLAGELMAAQRYYYRITPSGTNYPFGFGQCYTTTTGGSLVQFPVTMRIKPTALEQSGTASHYQVYTAGGAGATLTAVPTYASVVTTEQIGAINFTVASGLVAGDVTQFNAASSSGYLGWSAEL